MKDKIKLLKEIVDAYYRRFENDFVPFCDGLIEEFEKYLETGEIPSRYHIKAHYKAVNSAFKHCRSNECRELQKELIDFMDEARSRVLRESRERRGGSGIMQKATEWLMELNPFEMIKGHTKIELTDIHTGAKQIIEKDNAFQAGVLAKYMRSMGAYNNNPYANSTWAGQQIWRNLCGGIFCFRDPIDNSEDEVEYMPAGNEMVANGAYMVNNAGTPIELGSYNEVESSTSGNDSVTFVYDWMTSQGNGTISCVCLTTEIGGYIGYGNKSGAQASGKGFGTNQSSLYKGGMIYNGYLYQCTSVDNATHKMTFTKTPVEITKGSIFDNLVEETFEIEFTGNDVSFYKSAGAPIPIGGGKCVVLCQGGYYTDWQYWNNGQTRTLLIVVDLVNLTAHSVTLTNTTGDTLHITIYGCSGCVGVNSDYILWQNDGHNKIYAIKYNETQNVWTELGAGGNSTQRPMPVGGMLTSELMHVSNHIFDPENGTYYPMNGGADYAAYNPDTDTLCYSNTGGRDTYGGTNVYKNPLILSTINNLETPVTKTAAQTMKITYTLSKASE